MSTRPTMAEQLAEFVVHASYARIPEAARQQLKIRVLDSLGCAIGALDGGPVRLVREQLHDFGGNPRCTLIGGGRSAPDRTTFYNSALVRYLDFNDSFLAKGETCHPSDNLGAVLAAAEDAGRRGQDLLTALAVAYQVQGTLTEVAPVRAKGFDHTVQLSYGVACGVSKALGLDAEHTLNAIGICGTAFNALRVTRTGALSNWKGLAAPEDAFCCTQATYLAQRGITGPREVFEGNKGFMEAIAGPFSVDWQQQGLDLVTRTILKKYDAEIHSQSTIAAVLELRERDHLRPDEVDRVEVETFDVAYNIIGGGEEGEKQTIRTKEEADHSLPYLVAVALIDGQVMPEQFRPAVIQSPEVQSLLRRVTVRPSAELSRGFPQEMPSRVTVWLKDGRRRSIEKRAYEGFWTDPMRWETVVAKFDRLAAPYADAALRQQLADTVARLDTVSVADLTRLLAQVRTPGASAASQR
jgi:2-methylcitrate dehydratase